MSDPVRILIADSNSASAELVRSHLESLGYYVDWARDGDHALALAAAGEYPVMLLDVHMQNYRGVDVIRRMHLLIGRRMRVIAITKDRMQTIRDELQRMGVDGFLTRPVDLKQLQDELTRVLAKNKK
ncbi:MAG TPA: response regulator [Candidatus Dormibacteraeota bacterium]|nr:response regulator [Candidatus Dormibacteraeota bacterium]